MSACPGGAANPCDGQGTCAWGISNTGFAARLCEVLQSIFCRSLHMLPASSRTRLHMYTARFCSVLLTVSVRRPCHSSDRACQRSLCQHVHHHHSRFDLSCSCLAQLCWFRPSVWHCFRYG